MRNESGDKVELPEGIKPKISTMVIPLSVLLVVLFAYLTEKGLWYTQVEGTDIRTAIASGFLCATVVLIILCVKEKIFTFSKCVNIITGGCSNMMFMCIVLVLAWTLSGVTGTMDSANYLVNITRDLLNPALLPCILFILGAVMSFATGTSWGTMAILMPIGLPMAISLDVSLPLISAAIIGGGLYGDHCSPISDTTILASIGSACDHIDHFETQLPYATTVGIICAVMFMVTAWYTTPIMLVAAILILVAVIFVLHKASLRKYGISR